MSVRLKATVAAALAAVALGAVAAPWSTAEVAERATKNVKVGDDYFAPTDLKISKGSKVKWKWLDANTNSHNVRLSGEHPNGVKKGDFKSPTGSIGIVFKRKFEKTGKYGFYCSLHPTTMEMSVKVNKN